MTELSCSVVPALGGSDCKSKNDGARYQLEGAVPAEKTEEVVTTYESSRLSV